MLPFDMNIATLSHVHAVTIRRMRKLSLIASLFLLFFSAPSYCEEPNLSIIPLHFRSVDEVIPILQPLLSKDGSISGIQNQLIVRTNVASLVEIMKVLEAIDRPARNLIITVQQNADVDSQQDAVTISGTISSGKDTRIAIPDETSDRGGASVNVGKGDSQVKAKIFSTDSTDSDKNAQKLRVLEGRQAYIQIGQSIPVPQRTVVRDGNAVSVVDSVEYRDVISGFFVLPRVNADRVTLEIAPQRDTVGATGNVKIQRAHTVLSGKLGEWIDAGGVVDSEDQRDGKIGSYAVKTKGERRRILIKVEEAP
jgi:type II secretory pathway component GspD/PulD (secretin)